MPSPNRNIELSVEDMELIESALRARKAARASDDARCDEAREIHELLGRLHNQKVFYRPSSAPYVSG
ncbi:hypothetical protein [Primorskyibacter sp. S187A]|uniref:hypothetical protein n=1 Tax=Primorskyibacter sp. S187A TaxID=3415130 RepID=UPI003C7BD433